MTDEVRKVHLAERTEVLSKMLSTIQLRALDAARGPKGNKNFTRLLDRIDAMAHPM
jgi:hypothetical protein